MKETWVLPCNIKYYDIEKHFKENETIVWAKRKNICNEDVVYVYLAAPYSEIKYKCLVEDSSISLDYVEKTAPYALVNTENGPFKDYMLLKIVKEYPEGMLKRSELNQHGLGQVQMVARADRRLKAYIDDLEKIEKGVNNGNYTE